MGLTTNNRDHAGPELLRRDATNWHVTAFGSRARRVASSTGRRRDWNSRIYVRSAFKMSSTTYWMLALGISCVYSVNISALNPNQVRDEIARQRPTSRSRGYSERTIMKTEMATPNELRFLHSMTHKGTAKYKYCAPEIVMYMFDAAPDRFIPGSQSV